MEYNKNMDNYASDIPAGAGASSAGAYGSQGATGRFDPVAFIKKPQVILRLISSIFAVIVFGCILGSGWEGDVCYFNNDPSACGYGTAIGIISLLVLVTFIVLDFFFDNMSNAMHRKYVVIGDMAGSGVMSFLWFVCFCFLANSWRLSDFPNYWRGKSGIEASIAFSFFSTITFGALTVLAVLRYREGAPETISPQYNSDPFGGFETQGAP